MEIFKFGIFFGVLNGTQANILKCLTRVGLKDGESIADDRGKIIAYAENHLKNKLGLKHKVLSYDEISDIHAAIIQYIPRFNNSAYAQDLSYAVLCQDYKLFIDMVKHTDRFVCFAKRGKSDD